MRTKSDDNLERRNHPSKIDEPGMEEGNTRATKRKRKPSKPKEKNYDCPHEGCGKRYSRAEHLYRHQLNHAPKQIYHCDFEGCDRNFVRQDLCARHRERHTKENSHLYRKDAFKQNKNSTRSLNTSSKPNETSTMPPGDDQRMSSVTASSDDSVPQGGLSHVNLTKSVNSPSDFSSMALDPRLATGTADFHTLQQSNTFPSHDHNNEASLTAINGSMGPHPGIPLGFASPSQNSSGTLEHPMQHVMNPSNGTANTAAFARPRMLSDNTPMSHAHPIDVYNFSPAQSLFTPLHTGSTPQLPQPYLSPLNGSYKSLSAITSMPPLSSFGFSFPMSQSGGSRSDSVTSYVSKATPTESHISSQGNGLPSLPMLNGVSAGMTLPVFNNESYGSSSFQVPETEFMGWLFEGNHNWMYSPPPHNSGLGFSHHDARQNNHSMHLEPFPKTESIPKTILSIGQPESQISGPRRQQLLTSVLYNFKDERHPEVTLARERILEGNRDADSHVLSLHMMQTYISSFWLHIHGQLPILHRPTFSAETCPDLLLIPIMVLGASCLEKTHGNDVTESCAELSFFLAWHARHLIFEDPDFLPPAKLWVFQALIFLEIFEKNYATRALHERAHVHHSTTLTLMRRGSSLIGRSALDFHPYDKDPTRTPPGPNGSINTAGRNTTDEWWNYWISNEATRRTAFAAFIIDTIHANMFGHSAVMVAHEMRIPLPCDEALWSATKGAEVKRLEQSLAVKGYRPVGFLEALKHTLNSQSVRTNTFGRVIIMAGLLNVSWHMKMQDVRASSIGVGKQGSWGSQLLHAFDFWKRDFDDSLANSNNMFLQDRSYADGVDGDNVFESRTVLHHLAHMVMHVDVVDCQIFAGAKRLMGRVITTNDQVAASKRMRETWAPSAHARDATFYALRFLSEVLFTEDDIGAGSQHVPLRFEYSAREDNLLNRPWVLYFATLVVWSYGYSMDGPIAPPTYTLPTHEAKFRDMQLFLRRVGRVRSPDELQHIKDRNGCLGLLMLLRELFRRARWELLHEAGEMLGNCIELLMPGISST